MITTGRRRIPDLKAASSLSLALIVGLTLVTAFLLAWIGTRGIDGQVQQLLAMFAGISGGALIVLVADLADSWRLSREVPPIQFDEEMLTRLLTAETLVAEHRTTAPNTLRLLADDFVGVDNAIALAGLRIELERELESKARQAGLRPSRFPSASRRARELAATGILPASLLQVLDDVVRVVNRAVHGRAPSTEETASVMRVGEELIQQLRSLEVSERTASQNADSAVGP